MRHPFATIRYAAKRRHPKARYVTPGEIMGHLAMAAAGARAQGILRGE